jgi:hypothetical protein
MMMLLLLLAVFRDLFGFAITAATRFLFHLLRLDTIV